MHEIILILLCVGISAIPTGYFIKHDIPDIAVINKPVFKRKARRPTSEINSIAELDMEMFEGLQTDIQDIILKYI